MARLLPGEARGAAGGHAAGCQGRRGVRNLPLLPAPQRGGVQVLPQALRVPAPRQQPVRVPCQLLAAGLQALPAGVSHHPGRPGCLRPSRCASHCMPPVKQCSPSQSRSLRQAASVLLSSGSIGCGYWYLEQWPCSDGRAAVQSSNQSPRRMCQTSMATWRRQT